MTTLKPTREELLRLCKMQIWSLGVRDITDIRDALQEMLQPSPAPEPTMQDRRKITRRDPDAWVNDKPEMARRSGRERRVRTTPQAAVTLLEITDFLTHLRGCITPGERAAALLSQFDIRRKPQEKS